ncbi:MAG: carboxypeptidase regulatory-like domain-containing protein, partial [Candidatus Electryonea clarkiae]|nr:carboxypeptidase regulatory-like domain-containing protein [Candidatus Electryonea clarkiae]
CNILFESPQGIPSVTAPVTLIVDSEFGDLIGTVTEALTGNPVAGAKIIASNCVDNTYVTYTNDSGIYIIEDILAGYYSVECTADGYNSQVMHGVEIIVGQTTSQNFALTAPVMVVDPLSINTTVHPDNPVQIDITIQNNGNGQLEWNATIIQPDQKRISLPPASLDYPHGTDPTSFLVDTNPINKPADYNPIKFRGSTAWGYDAENNELVSFDVDIPSSFTTLGPITIGDFLAGDFLSGVNDFITAVCSIDDAFGTIDITNGVFNQVGTLPTTGSLIWEDFSRDPTDGTLYGIQTHGYESYLFVIDPVNVTATLVGPIGFEIMISLAIDGDGNMWGVDIDDDVLVSIDKRTGVGTEVGPVGFTANYAQSATWDPVSGNVLLAAYSTIGELRVVDTSTGNTAVVGQLGPYGHETTLLAIPDDFVQPWITIEPDSNIVPVGENSILSVFINTADYSIGDTLNANIEIASDPVVGAVTVPVTVFVDEVSTDETTQITETNMLANFPNPMLHSTTFSFSLKERSHVMLSIYNVKGQLVDVLVDEEIDPTPSYKVEWNGTANGKKLANGIYFYKLETNSKTFLNKMILLK